MTLLGGIEYMYKGMYMFGLRDCPLRFALLHPEKSLSSAFRVEPHHLSFIFSSPFITLTLRFYLFS